MPDARRGETTTSVEKITGAHTEVEGLGCWLAKGISRMTIWELWIEWQPGIDMCGMSSRRVRGRAAPRLRVLVLEGESPGRSR